MRLLQAHKQLLDEGLEHNLWILGDGPERETLERYVAENNLNGSVWMPGFIENPYPFMREADLLACSSVFEGFSTFLTEGVILGKPVITTDVSGAYELLGDSVYGLIVENDDEAFCKGFSKMMLDDQLREHYCRCVNHLGEQFSSAALTQDTEAFFEELMQK